VQLVAEPATIFTGPSSLGSGSAMRIMVQPWILDLPRFSAPGFRVVNLAKADLDLIVAKGLESWRTALSNVAGVYLISDTTTGKLYVGSALGAGGIWQRWCCYANDCHGGNVELKRLIEMEGRQRANAFRFTVLEIADIHASKDDILCRESLWKRVLLTRLHGHNAN
jgi:hypothetical protein